jgi:hypothetical protein
MPFMQDLLRLSLTGGGQMLRHQLKPLQSDHARQLFCSWQRTQPWVQPRELQRLEDAIVEACAGLPLALNITGALLNNVPEPGRWQVGGLRRRGASRACAGAVAAGEDFASHVPCRKAFAADLLPLQGPDKGCAHCFLALHGCCCLLAAAALPCLQYVLDVMREGAKLADADTDKRLKRVLVTSFENLEGEAAQNMFLDIASVLHGRSANRAKKLWDAWWGNAAYDAFSELQRRALLYVDGNRRLRTHDVIKAFGRGIICDPKYNEYYGSRAWVREDGQLVRFKVSSAVC